MMAFENGPCQIVEVAPAGLVLVSLTLLLGGIEALLEEALVTAKRAPYPLGPTQFAYFPVAIRIVDQVLNVDDTTAHNRFYHEIALLR